MITYLLLSNTKYLALMREEKNWMCEPRSEVVKKSQQAKHNNKPE